MNTDSARLNQFCLWCAPNDPQSSWWQGMAAEFGGEFAFADNFPKLLIDQELIKQLSFRCLAAEIELVVFTSEIGTVTTVDQIGKLMPESRQRSALQDVPLATTSQASWEYLVAHGLGERLTLLPSRDWRELLAELAQRYALDQSTVAIETFAQRTQLTAGLEARGAQVVLLDLFPAAVPYPPRLAPTEFSPVSRLAQALWVSHAEQLLQWYQWIHEQALDARFIAWFGCDRGAQEIAMQMGLNWHPCDWQQFATAPATWRELLAEQIADSLRPR